MYEKYAKLRDERNLTDYAVANQTGIAPSTLSDWKNGRTVPKADKLKLIAELFGVHIEDLI